MPLPLPLLGNMMSVWFGVGCVLIGIGVGILVVRIYLGREARWKRAPSVDSTPSLEEIAQLPLMLMKLAEQLDQRPSIQNQLAEIIRLAKLQATDIDRIVRDSRTDALTGLWNRRALDEQAPLQFSLSQRYATPLSVVMVDIDHFKRLNDEHGHATGDAALRHVAGVLRQGLRESDFIARYGGEEFAIFLPQTDLAGALMATERLRQIVADTPFTEGDRLIEVRVSMGIAQVRRDEHVGDVIARADAALLHAKQAGRNQVRAESGWSGTLANSAEAVI
jgi:diguanylate cyclase (GGDEF)-like protein